MVPTFVLFSWPIIVPLFFVALGRQRGLIWSVTIGYLFLPDAWHLDLPGLPVYGKGQAIALGLVLGLILTRSDAPPTPEPNLPIKWMFAGLLFLVFAGPFVTMLTNPDPIVFSNGRVLPALGLWDVQNQIIRMLVELTPFFLARRYLFSPEMHREVLKVMVISGAFYALLILYELRMSPQLNNIVYGYFPHSFLQHIRDGYWRPLVFLSHGLELGFFLMTVVLAAVGLLRTAAGEVRTVLLVATVIFFALLAVSQNLGALAISLLLTPAAFLLTPKIHLRIAVIVAVLFMAYPLMRDFYAQPALMAVESISADRAGSLAFRFDNEERLVARAFERPLAGWGPWARWIVFGPNGEDISIPDGTWIIQLGMWGWIGFVGLFGLLIAPLLIMKRAARHSPCETVTSVMVLMVAANLIDLIPNSTLTPAGWLVAGALAGYVQFAPGRTKASGANEPDVTAERRRELRYTRFDLKTRDNPDRLSRFN